MASAPPENKAFLQEVDEELRRDQVADFWKRWGRWLVAAIIVALAVFGGWLWWQNEQVKQAEAQGEVLNQVLTDLEEGKRTGAEAKLKPLAEGEVPGYRATAQLTLASLKLQANDAKGAAAGFKAVAEDASLPKPYRDLALVRWTAAEYDTLKPQDVIARLKPLAQKGNPWFGSAGEMVAIAHLNLNQGKLAGTLFASIAGDPTVPETIRQRAVQMAGVLGVDAVAQPGGETPK